MYSFPKQSKVTILTVLHRKEGEFVNMQMEFSCTQMVLCQYQEQDVECQYNYFKF